jgi:general secretion pathway protein G
MSARARGSGFTLLELMTAALVGALLLSIAVPTYRAQIEKMKVEQAKRDLIAIAGLIERFRTTHAFKLPDSLDQLTGVPSPDPWGNAYAFLNFSAPIPGIKGKIRKDHNLHPLNTEFDLYSLGADGRSAAPLTAKASQDDVLWAQDGSFVGLASDF